MIKLGIIREGKTPPDERVPLTPTHLRTIVSAHPEVSIEVQSSPVRRIQDAQYSAVGFVPKPYVEGSDILLGVKEVPIEQLIPAKTYFFFSHTIKKQSHNKKLLRAVLEKNITLIDWECLTDASGRRVIGFGFYAGLVGTYNAIRAYGLRNKTYHLKRAIDCVNRSAMEAELAKAKLPPIKILLSGAGKVAKGAVEILDKLNIRKVAVDEYLSNTFDYAVYCQIEYNEYYKRTDGKPFDASAFLNNPAGHESNFGRFARSTDVYIAGHFWGAGSPPIFTADDARDPACRISLVADISCDVGGPVATTLRASTIAEPLYGYDPQSGTETAFDAPGSITVMAVDNLPCELPVDASQGFGEMFIDGVLPALLNGDKDRMLARGTIARGGKLTDRFAYLQDWVEG